MTQKTTYKRAKRKFDMSKLSKNIQRRLRRKNKTKVTRRKIREVWKDIVEEMITKPLIETGKVNVDGRLTFEIVGERVVNKKSAVAVMSKGLMGTKKGLKPLKEINYLRRGIVYGIEMNDSRAKTKLYFDANPKIKKRVFHELKYTAKQYKINGFI